MNPLSGQRALAWPAVALAACTSTAPLRDESGPAWLGTWAEVVITAPANPSDGRQVIERAPDGQFKMVFLRTHPSQPPCTGRWAQAGTAHRMVFTSVACFGGNASKPAIGQVFELELLESPPGRLRFRVPAGAPIAPLQAKLEGGID